MEKKGKNKETLPARRAVSAPAVKKSSPPAVRKSNPLTIKPDAEPVKKGPHGAGKGKASKPEPGGR